MCVSKRERERRHSEYQNVLLLYVILFVCVCVCVSGANAPVPCDKPTESMESVRNDFAVETDTNGLVGIQSARQPTAPLTPALNSLKNWGSELR